MEDIDDETAGKVKFEAACKVAQRDAYARLGRDVPEEELIQAIRAHPAVKALAGDPSVRPYILNYAARELIMREPDLVRAAELDYPGALQRLLDKVKARAKRIGAGLEKFPNRS
jgi:hypothetical protein